MFELKMVLERETKGAVRYQEVETNGSPVKGNDAIIGTLYIRKVAFNDGQTPKAIEVTIQ